MIAMAKFCRNFTYIGAGASEDLDTACRYGNADYVAFMANAISHIAEGKEDEA